MKKHIRAVKCLPLLAVCMYLSSCSSGKDSSLFPVQVGRFLYVIGDSDVAAFKIDANTGKVTPVAGSPFASAFSIANSPCPDLAATDPEGKFLFVPDSCNDNIVIFAIDQNTGALTPASGSPFAAGTGNFDLQQPVVDPTGKFLYVPEDFTGTVRGYKIGANGALTAVAGAPFTAGGQDEGLVIHPNGNFLYSADAVASSTISGFTIDANTGALTAVAGSPFALPEPPKFMVIDPSGRFLYASGPDNDHVLVFKIDVKTGGLTAISGSPFTAGPNPQGLAVASNGKFLFVENSADQPAVPGNVSAFKVDPSTGALTAVPGSPFTAGPNPKRIAVDPSCRYVYVTNDDSDNMTVFSIDPGTGALKEIPGSPFATNVGPEGVTIAR